MERESCLNKRLLYCLDAYIFMNCTIVILGATGDLTKKKLIPALYNLIKNKKLEKFIVVGVARDRSQNILEHSKKFIKNLDSKTFNILKDSFHYFSANFQNKASFVNLKKFILDLEKKNTLPGNRLFYLATLPTHFEVIANQLGEQGFNKKDNCWHRVVFEKPFGSNLKSARLLNRGVQKVFKESQIFRIDHYLGKELVQNLSILRFTNIFLEPIWNKKYIDNIQIILSENFGVGDRGSFYDKYGALKDVVQNHALQLLALTAMEKPSSLSTKVIREKKLSVLKKTKLKKSVFGQYEGYKKENGVKPNSSTETFFSGEFQINNSRWKRTPFYILTGKNLKNKLVLIHVEFKKLPCGLLKGVCDFIPNHLTIEIQPKEGFHLHINAKVPGKKDIKPVKMDYCQSCVEPNSPKAYENLLLDVFQGNKSSFIHAKEVETSWKIIDKIKKQTIYTYKKGTIPPQANVILKKDVRWHLDVD